MSATERVAPIQKVSTEISPENLAFLCRTVYENSGIVLDESKMYLIESRLGPVARGEGLETLDSLCKLLKTVSAKALRTKVVEAMTTNETLFSVIFGHLRRFAISSCRRSPRPPPRAHYASGPQRHRPGRKPIAWPCSGRN